MVRPVQLLLETFRWSAVARLQQVYARRAANASKIVIICWLLTNNGILLVYNVINVNYRCTISSHAIRDTETFIARRITIGELLLINLESPSRKTTVWLRGVCFWENFPKICVGIYSTQHKNIVSKHLKFSYQNQVMYVLHIIFLKQGFIYIARYTGVSIQYLCFWGRYHLNTTEIWRFSVMFM